MGLYEEHLLPRLVDWSLDQERYARLRRRLLAGIAGRVLEIGFGSGLNLPCYPGSVELLLAVEPSRTGRRLAGRRLSRAPFPVEFVGLSGEELALPDASVDAAVSTFTLCTIPDVERALGEIRRVLRPGGTFRFLEHGRSPEPRVARWQDRLNPLQKRLAGGCHLNRPIDRLVAGAGLAVASLECFYAGVPRFATYLYEGRAGRAEPPRAPAP